MLKEQTSNILKDLLTNYHLKTLFLFVFAYIVKLYCTFLLLDTDWMSFGRERACNETLTIGRLIKLFFFYGRSNMDF